MKKKLLNNWPIKLLSLVFAFVLWLIVIKAVDPVITRTFDIPVEFLHEEVLAQRGILVRPLDTAVVVKVSQTRSIVSALTDEDFYASADYEKMYRDTQVPVTVISKNSKISDENFIQENFSIEVDVQQVESINRVIECTTKGTPMEGYIVGGVSTSPGSVNIIGPADVLARIDKVTATIDVDGINETKISMAEIEIYDDAGNIINPADVAGMSLEGGELVTCTAKILTVQTVPVRVDIKNKDRVAQGFVFAGAKASVDSVRIIGSRNAVLGTKEIVIDDISVTDASESFTSTSDLRRYLADGIEVDGSSEVTISVYIDLIPVTEPVDPTEPTGPSEPTTPTTPEESSEQASEEVPTSDR
ncbi:MAG: hypothetical protein KBS79_04965 [Lachnospiraceae bacterium]|nr:hypothetical protein [Candidatus Minthocola equi]